MFAEDGEQGLVVGIEVQHHLGDLPDQKHRDASEELEHPACGGAFRGMAFLVGERLPVFRQALPDAVFEGGVDHQAQRHDGHQGHDALGRLEEQGGRHEQGVLEEAEAALDLLLVFLVGIDDLLVAEDAFVDIVGGDDEGAFLPQLPGMDVQPGRQLAFDGVADHTGLLAFRRAAFLGVAGPRGDAALGDRRQLERFGEGVQRRLGVRLAGEAWSAEGVEGLQLGLALPQVPPL